MRYICFVRYPKNGLPIIESVNTFGASTHPESRHYKDQMEMFQTPADQADDTRQTAGAEVGRERVVSSGVMAKELVRPIAYSPGRLHQKSYSFAFERRRKILCSGGLSIWIHSCLSSSVNPAHHHPGYL